MRIANCQRRTGELPRWPCRNRRGLASIEFLLMLPAIVCSVGFIFWLYRTRDAALRAGLTSEAAAMETAVWTRNVQALQDTDRLGVGGGPNMDLLVGSFASGLSAESGWVQATVQEPTGPGVLGVVDAIGEVSASHGLLTHPFDSEVLRFPQNGREQPPLTLPSGAQALAPGLGLSVFSRLLSF